MNKLNFCESTKRRFVDSPYGTGASLPRMLSLLSSAQRDGVAEISGRRSSYTPSSMTVVVLSNNQREHVVSILGGSGQCKLCINPLDS